jgi:hypothetical protein
MFMKNKPMKVHNDTIEKYLESVEGKRTRAITIKMNEYETNLYYEVKDLSNKALDRNVVPDICRKVLVDTLEKLKLDLLSKLP